jgi:hypothetical protein
MGAFRFGERRMCRVVGPMVVTGGTAGMLCSYAIPVGAT